MTETHHEGTKKTHAHRATKLHFGLLIAVGVLVLLILATGVFAVGLYGFGWKGATVDRITRVVPFPALLADARPISLAQYQADLATLKLYYQKNPPTADQQTPTEQDLQKVILNRQLYDVVLNRLARQYKVTVSADDVQKQLDAIATQANTKDLAPLLQQLYGMTQAQFENKVLRPYLVYTKLQTAVAADTALVDAAKKKAEDIDAKAKAHPDQFEALAKQYSEDSTASVGGDVGFFGKGTMVEEFEKAAFAMNAGDISDVVKSKFGFHIIQVVEKVTDPAKGEQVHARHILIRQPSADQLIQANLQKMRVTVLVKGFVWDATRGWVTLK